MLLKIIACVFLISIVVDVTTAAAANDNYNCYQCRHNPLFCSNASLTEHTQVQCNMDKRCGTIHLTQNGVTGIQRDCYHVDPCVPINPDRSIVYHSCDTCQSDLCNGSGQIIFNSLLGISCMIIISALKVHFV